MKELWTSMASIMGVMAFFQTLIATIFPPQLRYSLLSFLHRFTARFSPYCYFDITEIFDGVNSNELYSSVQLYLSTAAVSGGCGGGPTRLSLSRSLNASSVTFGLAHNDTIFDSYDGVVFRWDHIVVPRNSSNSYSWRPVPDEKRGFTLRVGRAHRARLDPYLDHISRCAADIQRRSRDRWLYTNSRGAAACDAGRPWEGVPFKHPSTFDTLAMDPDRKATIVADLKDFASGESFYRATGRAWKRGYLLYGPPGTGKSSMIAAMANYLEYDVYDLELTEVSSNSKLRKLLMKTAPKSIVVIEDIDCSVDLTRLGPTKKRPGRVGLGGGGGMVVEEEGTGRAVTLSGLLNFTDGLWSCCGSERIFVFTTNHVERLDPALLRKGRMDMHIHLGSCDYESLKVLLKNYLGLEMGELGEGVRRGFEEVVEAARMTPADVSEVLIRVRRREKEAAVAEVLAEMRRRAEGNRRGGKGEKVDSEAEEEEKRELETDNGGGGGEERGSEGGGGVVDSGKVSDENGKKFD